MVQARYSYWCDGAQITPSYFYPAYGPSSHDRWHFAVGSDPYQSYEVTGLEVTVTGDRSDVVRTRSEGRDAVTLELAGDSPDGIPNSLLYCFDSSFGSYASSYRTELSLNVSVKVTLVRKDPDYDANWETLSVTWPSDASLVRISGEGGGVFMREGEVKYFICAPYPGYAAPSGSGWDGLRTLSSATASFPPAVALDRVTFTPVRDRSSDPVRMTGFVSARRYYRGDSAVIPDAVPTDGAGTDVVALARQHSRSSGFDGFESAAATGPLVLPAEADTWVRVNWSAKYEMYVDWWSDPEKESLSGNMFGFVGCESAEADDYGGYGYITVLGGTYVRYPESSGGDPDPDNPAVFVKDGMWPSGYRIDVYPGGSDPSERLARGGRVAFGYPDRGLNLAFNPGDRTLEGYSYVVLTAVPGGGLILYDPADGRILHGKSGSVLYDG